MTELRWGLAGPGHIAHGIARDLALMGDDVLTAVGSRSLERATAFARQYGAARAHGSYAELLADPEVDVVYVATTNRQHAALALDALRAGKHLLVEKSFTCTVAGARAVIELARESGLFVMEAMWTRFQPVVVRMNELIAAGEIGEVRSVHADLGLVRGFDPGSRLWDPAQGGGALLDLGVYPVSWANMLLGAPESVLAQGKLGPTGVEQEAALFLTHADGRRALLDTSLRSPLPGAAAVYGTEGRIDVLPRFHHPDTMVLHREDKDPERIELPATGGGYVHELAEVHDCIAAGRTESAVMPLQDSLDVMVVLQEALLQLGIRMTDEGIG